MQIRQAALIDDTIRILEHRLGFRRKSCDEVSAEDDIRADLSGLLAKGDGVGAQVTSFHALQRQVVARLQRQMQMRHQAFLVTKRYHQIVVGFNLIDRRKAQAFELRHVLQHLAYEFPKRRGSWKIAAIRRYVDAGQNDLGITFFDERSDLRDDLAGSNRSRRATPKGDDAKRATMIAAILNLHISAGARSETVDQMQRRFPHAHDVVDLNARAGFERQSRERFRLGLFIVSYDVIDFRHLGEALGLDLRRASRHDDPRFGLLATKPANGLRGLPHGFVCYGARVDDDRIVEPCRARVTAHDLGLIRIEPAAERDHLGFGHETRSSLF